MSSLPLWVRLPTQWIEADHYGLQKFKWSNNGGGSDNIAALMILFVIAHNTNSVSRLAKVTYTEITEATGLCRSKISNGLKILDSHNIAAKHKNKRSVYCLNNYDQSSGWAKFPARPLYDGKKIKNFHEFNLRKKTELDALILYFLFVSRRDRKYNAIMITYDKIVYYTSIRRERIKSAISFLASIGMLYIDKSYESADGGYKTNRYVIPHIDSYRHSAFEQ